MRNLLLVLLLLLSSFSWSQTNQAPRIFAVSDIQTINIVFPSAIISVDRGSERIVVQKSVNNVLRVKAESAFSDTTNLTVITNDGALYSFLVHFSKSPSVLTINISGKSTSSLDTLVTSTAAKVFKLKNNLYGLKGSEGKVQLSLCGVYATGEWVILKLRIENNSSLSYTIGGVRFYSRERANGRRRSTQEREVTAILTIKPETVVREKQLQVFAVILAKPSLVLSRKLTINLFEKDGERNFSVGVSNRHLVGAALLK